MTVAELIAKLQTFPLDTQVEFTAEMGHIYVTDPAFELAPETDDSPRILYIDLDS